VVAFLPSAKTRLCFSILMPIENAKS